MLLLLWMGYVILHHSLQLAVVHQLNHQLNQQISRQLLDMFAFLFVDENLGYFVFVIWLIEIWFYFLTPKKAASQMADHSEIRSVNKMANMFSDVQRIIGDLNW